MSDMAFEKIQECCKYLKIDLYAAELARYAEDASLSLEQIAAVEGVFSYLQERKEESIVNTLLKMSRLPLKEPKTFESFDFEQVHGKQVDKLKNLPTLSAIYAHRNIAFIGPQGVGKTHLAMAYGRACCMKGMKTYFLKASELNQRLSDAVRFGREGSVVANLVKPSCLIIDEIGRCVFNKANTRLFFDLIDRRYNKDGANTMIFTGNIGPDKWSEYFEEDSALLCTLDRIFDEATVFMMKGNSYRGKRLETIAIETGSSAITNKK